MLQTHGDDDIDWLVEKYFPMLDAQILKNQALKVPRSLFLILLF